MLTAATCFARTQLSEDERISKYQKYCNDRVTFRDGVAYPKHKTEGKYYVSNGTWLPVELGNTTQSLLVSLGYETPTLAEATATYLRLNDVSSLEEKAIMDGFGTVGDIDGWLASNNASTIEELAQRLYGVEGSTSAEDIAAMRADWGGRTIEEIAAANGYGT